MNAIGDMARPCWPTHEVALLHEPCDLELLWSSHASFWLLAGRLHRKHQVAGHVPARAGTRPSLPAFACTPISSRGLWANSTVASVLTCVELHVQATPS